MTQETEKPESEDSEALYLYKNSGLMERHGTVPFWLILVGIGLIVWTIYYIIQYWSAD